MPSAVCFGKMIGDIFSITENIKYNAAEQTVAVYDKYDNPTEITDNVNKSRSNVNVFYF